MSMSEVRLIIVVITVAIEYGIVQYAAHSSIHKAIF